jgi:putative ABC transport system permease protein
MRRFFNLFRREKLSREVSRELDFHLAERVDQLIAAGMTPSEARRQARRRFGAYALHKEDTWTASLLGWLEALATDVRYALRGLAKSPGFAAVAIITLALGIGANTAMFSAVDAVLIRPLPYADADRLVMIWEDASNIGFPTNQPSPANWQQWLHNNTVFTDIAATRGGAFLLSGGGEPEHISGRMVTANFWTVLGSQPLLGRVFTEEEDRKHEPVAVISYALWQRRFGGTPDVLGQKLILNDNPVIVIGVMRPEFYFLHSRLVDIWIPTSFTPEALAWRSHFIHCIARLEPGVTLGEARVAMTALGKRMTAESHDPQSMPVLVPVREELAGQTRTSLIVLLAASACVLLIACANLANLLLARGKTRQREVAVRSALGAGRGRLIAQFLTESLVLALLGAAAGLALARPAMTFLETLTPSTMPAIHLSLDWRVTAFCALTAIAAGVAFGLAPALGGTRASLQAGMREGGRGIAGSRRQWLQHSLIVVETSLAVVLLTCGGLLLQTLRHLHQVDLGIRTDKVLTMLLPMNRYPDFHRRSAFIDGVLEKIHAVPGVVDAAFISSLPLTDGGSSYDTYQFAGQSSSQAEAQTALNRVVTRDYFKTVGARLREGRFFDQTDRASNQPVAVVSESFADRNFPGRSAIGARFQFGQQHPGSYEYTVVGVVREIRERGVAAELQPVVYFVNEQADQNWTSPGGLLIRTSGNPTAVVPGVREAVWSLDANEPFVRIQTLDHIIANQLFEPAQDSVLLAAFATLALILACVGLYGVLSYAVAQRTNEIGVRMALGATPLDILLAFGRSGVGLTGIGLGLGLLLAMAATRLLKSLLYGVAPDYAATLAEVSAILLVVAALASFFPARRAARLDPVAALRSE